MWSRIQVSGEPDPTVMENCLQQIPTPSVFVSSDILAMEMVMV
jgi:hypothetical protein